MGVGPSRSSGYGSGLGVLQCGERDDRCRYGCARPARSGPQAGGTRHPDGPRTPCHPRVPTRRTTAATTDSEKPGVPVPRPDSRRRPTPRLSSARPGSLAPVYAVGAPRPPSSEPRPSPHPRCRRPAGLHPHRDHRTTDRPTASYGADGVGGPVGGGVSTGVRASCRPHVGLRPGGATIRHLTRGIGATSPPTSFPRVTTSRPPTLGPGSGALSPPSGPRPATSPRRHGHSSSGRVAPSLRPGTDTRRGATTRRRRGEVPDRGRGPLQRISFRGTVRQPTTRVSGPRSPRPSPVPDRTQALG